MPDHNRDDAKQLPFLARLNRNVHDGPAATARLHSLGLDLQSLIDAVIAAEIERRSTSPLEPPGAAGSRAWFTAFRVIAERLIVLEDWTRDTRDNLPRMVNTKTRIAVAVCGGDDAVGLRARSPKSKHEKGSASRYIVRSNQVQLSLFANEARFRPVPRAEEQITWWLLMYSDEIETLRAELSLPVGLDDADHISDWKERILLELPQVDGSLRRDADDGTPEFEVRVSPRA